MAQALEHLWQGPLEGTVVTRYGYGADCDLIEILEANHPVPDENGMAGARRLMQRVSALGEDDLVIALITGGGSALLPAPRDGLGLEDEVALNEVLLKSGAPISAMNAIRKQFSAIKGGRLALLAYPAKVVTLIVSDVPGDHPGQVASGPTVPDSSDLEDALRYLERYRIDLPQRLRSFLDNCADDTPRPDDPRFERNEVQVVASAALSLAASARACRDTGIGAAILSDRVEGEAREVAKVFAAIALEIAARGQPFARPIVLLSGGETTVTVAGSGKGGRNSEFILSFASAIDGRTGIHALAADTDGIDGTEDNAGAFADGKTLERIQRAGLDPFERLVNNDAWTALDRVGDLFFTGPTGINVNDFRAVLIEK